MLAISVLMLDSLGAFDLVNLENLQTSLFSIEPKETKPKPVKRPAQTKVTLAEILEISPTTDLIAGDPVSFKGSGKTFKDSISTYEWKSNLDGALSQKQFFTSTSLKPGEHVISFRVQDNTGEWSDSVQATLSVDAAPPQPEIHNWNTPESCAADTVCPLAFDIHNNSDTSAESAFVYLELAPEWLPQLISKPGKYAFYDVDSVLTNQNDESVTLSSSLIRWETSFNANETQSFWVQLVPTFDEENLLLEDLATEDSAEDAENITENPTLWYKTWVVMEKDDQEFTGPVEGELSSLGYPSIEKTVEIILPENHAPSAKILSINPNPVSENTLVYFIGSGEDLLDQHSIVEYRWTSSIDGVLGYGPEIKTGQLSVGTHRITLDVKDEKGLWSNEDPKTSKTATQTLTVQPVYTGPI